MLTRRVLAGGSALAAPDVPEGQPGQVVARAPADSTSATISGTSLNLYLVRVK